jgi:hypothetical protein
MHQPDERTIVAIHDTRSKAYWLMFMANSTISLMDINSERLDAVHESGLSLLTRTERRSSH